MKTIHIILSSVLLLSVLSCEREMDIPLKPGTGRLYLECFPSDGNDTTYISLTAASPVTDGVAPGRLSGRACRPEAVFRGQ